MVDRVEDPCREEGPLPAEDPGSDGAPTNVVPASGSWNEGGTPPAFPDLDLESDFLEIEDPRYTVMVPRIYYYFPWLLGSLQNLRRPDFAYDRSLLAEWVRPTGEEFRELNLDRVDQLRFCLGRVYSRFYPSVDNFMATTTQGPDLEDGVIFDTSVVGPGTYSEVHGALAVMDLSEAFEEGFLRPEGLWEQMDIYREDYLQVSVDITPEYPRPNKNLKAIDIRMPRGELIPSAADYDLVPASSKKFPDTAFKAPAGFFALEATDRLAPLPNQVSIKSYIPNQLIYSDETPTWLGGEYDYQEDRARADREYPPELDKQSLYRRYSYEYGDNGNGVPFPCAQDDKVQKFGGPATRLIHQVNNYATNVSENRSFYNIAKDVIQVHNRIRFSKERINTGNITRLFQKHGLDNLLIGMFDIESPSNEEIYAQILESKTDWYQYQGEEESIYYKPRAYEDILKLLNEYIDSYYEDETGEEPFAYRKKQEALDQDDFPLGYLNVTDDNLWKSQPNENMSNEENLAMLHLGQFYHAQERLENFVDFFDEAKQFLVATQRSYRDILNGRLCDSEVLGFRIEKMHAETQEVIQNFYFFNNPEVEDFDFIDSQILYGQEYIYKIFTINFVQGTKYFYETDEELIEASGDNPPNYIRQYVSENVDSDGAHTGRYDLKLPVIMKTHYCVIEAPFFEQRVLVADLPPLPPHTLFARGEHPADLSRANLMIFFKEQFGRVSKRPTPIREGDEEIIAKMKRVQNVAPSGRFLEYRSDSIPTHYQMFLSAEVPTSYSDFSDKVFVETSREYPYYGISLEKGTSVYACYRSKDFAGISYPSTIYKISVDEVGFWTISEYQFEEGSDELTFQRVLEIGVSDEQSTINVSTSADYNNLEGASELTETSRGTDGVSLGDLPSEESVWDRRFRFRATSTSTGRALEIEATFAQENHRRRSGGDPITGMDIDFLTPEGAFELACTRKAIERSWTESQIERMRERVRAIGRLREEMDLANATRLEEVIDILLTPINPSGENSGGY